MEKFTTLTHSIIPLNLDNVDTDMIIPAQYLKSISSSGYGEYLFVSLRELYPDFILNNPNYNQGKILISRNNFGCGSSREHAVWAIKQYGISAVICSSFSDIFFNNASKNGLLLISLDEHLIDNWLKLCLSDHSLQMTIDLENQQINFQNSVYNFNYDPYRKHCLINGLDDLDYLLSCNEDITNYEKTYCDTTR